MVVGYVTPLALGAFVWLLLPRLIYHQTNPPSSQSASATTLALAESLTCNTKKRIVCVRKDKKSKRVCARARVWYVALRSWLWQAHFSLLYAITIVRPCRVGIWSCERETITHEKCWLFEMSIFVLFYFLRSMLRFFYWVIFFVNVTLLTEISNAAHP